MTQSRPQPKTGKDVNILSLSDLHLFNKLTRTEFMTANLQREINEFILSIICLDYLILAGDVFDEIRYWPDDEVYVARSWIRWLIGICNERGIKLRVMEGTSSHDRGQSRHFRDINEDLPESARADLKYIDTLEIVKEDDGLTFLYVPDEWHHDPDVVWEQVLEKMALAGVDKVDVSVTHGMYRHQLPRGIPDTVTAHDPDRYLSITNYYVLNGHIHSPRIYKKRHITNGSFDRIAQGEEEPKGMWHIKISMEGQEFDTVRFIKNRNAMVMVTVDTRGMDIIAAKAAIAEWCVEDERRFIRVHIDYELYADGLLQHYVDTYPMIVWRQKVERSGNKASDAILSSEALPTYEPMNSRTIRDQLSLAMRSNGVSEEEIQSALLILEHEMGDMK